MWITDITHFLREGRLHPGISGPARRLAEHLGSIIAAETGAPVDDLGPEVRCRRRPGRKPCIGVILHGRHPDGRIVWECSECDDAGFIANWQCTIWDRTPTHGVH
jgi:hypothetical protein